MARAAVKAKQQARASTERAKPSRARGRRRHSGGGNPNQQLFFMKLRRRQKWVFVLLAVVFAVSFAGIGIGSGNGGGLDQLYSGLFGGNGDAVSKAKGEIKTNPAKGYLDLARAYETKSDTAGAVTALQSYLTVKRRDATGWAELGGLELTQGQTYATRYQQAQQAAQLADPSQPFQAGGPLGSALGTNPAFQTASQQSNSRLTQLYQQATTALSSAVQDYKRATKLQPHSATAQQELATAATTAGNYSVALAAWKRYLQLYPSSPQRAAIKAQIKKLESVVQAQAPAQAKQTTK